MGPTSPSGRLRGRRESRRWPSWEPGALLAAAAVGYAAYQLMPVPDVIWQRRVALALDDSTDVYLPFWRAMLQPVASLICRFAPAQRPERRFARDLPAAVQILSLLVATDQSLSQAMRRLSE